MSGIVAEDKCITEFECLKLRKKGEGGEKMQGLVFRIKDEKIAIDKVLAHGATYEDFCDAIQSDAKDGAYGVFDYHYTTDDGRPVEKLLFISWVPDAGLPIRKKMLYGSTKESFRQVLIGIHLVVEASDASDIEEAEILKGLNRV